MNLDELIDHALSLPEPWHVVGAEHHKKERKVELRVAHEESLGACPKCSKLASKYDSRSRRWRHLDMWDHQTWITCEIPRVKCPEHGVVQVDVPWADGYSRFTSQFECQVIGWLLEASVQAVARNYGLSWGQVHGIQKRAVERGLARRGPINVKRIGVDETSFQKRHEYVTIVTDQENGTVLHVADDRKSQSLESFFEGLDQAQLDRIEVVAMDMHWPYIKAGAMHVPGFASKLCFDRFHVAQHFGEAVDKTRRLEHKQLQAEGDDRLKGTKYHWLKRPKSLSAALRRELRSLVESSLLIGQVWAVKEAASKLWDYKSWTWAKKAWVALLEWAETIDSSPLQRVVRTISKHLLGILNAIVLKATNAGAESINSKVQALKRRANGYRNRERFRDAILFHCGGLDLYPAVSAHTNQ
jgi:transposase